MKHQSGFSLLKESKVVANWIQPEKTILFFFNYCFFVESMAAPMRNTIWLQEFNPQHRDHYAASISYYIMLLTYHATEAVSVGLLNAKQAWCHIIRYMLQEVTP